MDSIWILVGCFLVETVAILVLSVASREALDWSDDNELAPAAA